VGSHPTAGWGGRATPKEILGVVKTTPKPLEVVSATPKICCTFTIDGNNVVTMYHEFFLFSVKFNLIYTLRFTTFLKHLFFSWKKFEHVRRETLKFYNGESFFFFFGLRRA
jgi:hypothetical protein